MAGRYMLVQEYRTKILRAYFLNPCGIDDNGFSYCANHKRNF